MKTGKIGILFRLFLVVVLSILAFSIERSTAGAAPSEVPVGNEVMFALSSPIEPNLLTLDPATGVVLQSVPVTHEQELYGLAYDGWSLWSIDGFNDGLSDRLFKIKPPNGSGAVAGDTGFNWNFRSVASHPLTGVLYGMTDNDLYTLDKVTGAATLVAPLSTNLMLDQVTALAIDGSGTAYATDIIHTSLFTLDLESGLTTHLGELSLDTFFLDLAFDQYDRLWGTGCAGGDLYLIDTFTVSAEVVFAGRYYSAIAFGSLPGEIFLPLVTRSD